MKNMNHATMLNEIALLSKNDMIACQSIVSSYEEYCAKNNMFPFKDSVNNEMIVHISNTTSYDTNIVKEVIDTMIDVVKTQIKYKIPFIRKAMH